MSTIFNTLTNKGIGFIATVCTILITGASLSGQIAITTQVTGPFEPYQSIEDLKSHTTVTVTSVDGGEIQYGMSLTCAENNIEMHTSNFYVDNYPIVLMGLNGDLDDLFDLANLEFGNDYSASVYNNGLPPGVYQLCFRTYFDGVPNSAGPPSGCATFVIPERTVTINTVFNPPHNTPLNNIENHLFVTLTSNDDVENCFLSFSIVGDNGISVVSLPTYRDNFDLTKHVPRIITGLDLEDLLSESILSFTGIFGNEAMENGLPAGNYTLCFRLWYDLNEPATGASPSGCVQFSISPPTLSIITQVLPPYLTNLSFYAEKAMVTLQSSAPVNARLSMKIEGQNGIEISTVSSYVPSSPIELNAGIPYVLSSVELDEYFDLNNLQVSGISSQLLSKNGLPEGMYRICFEVYDTKNNLLSQLPGCSNYFTIKYFEPPQLISPISNDSVSIGAVQNIVFSWTPSPGAPLSTEYILKIVEMPDGETNPDYAMLTATTPPFFEETVFGTSYFYGPADALLEKDKRYAWQVIAYDDETHAQFINQGKSQVSNFALKETLPQTMLLTMDDTPDFTDDTKWSNTQIYDRNHSFSMIPVSKVSGKINYKFKDAGMSIGDVHQTPVLFQKNANVQNLPAGASDPENVVLFSQQGVDFSAVQSYQEKNYSSTLQVYENGQDIIVGSNSISDMTFIDQDASLYSSGYLSTNKSKPLAGGIKLVLKEMYILVSDEMLGRKEKLFVDPNDLVSGQTDDGSFTNLGTTLATTYTNPDGTFEFSFVHTQTTGLINADYYYQYVMLEPTGTLQGGDLVYTTHTEESKGRLHRVLRILVESPYYCSPDVNIKVQPNESIDLGTLVSYVQSYTLQANILSSVSIHGQTAGSGKPLEGVNAYVVRRYDRNNEIPENEGDIGNLQGSKIMTDFGERPIISKDNSDGEGITQFSGMVLPDHNNDRYYVWVETPQKSGFYTYKSTYKISYNTPDTKYIFNNMFEVKNYAIDIYMIPNNPRIIGRVQDAKYNKPIPGALAILMSKSKIPVDEESDFGDWIDQVADFIVDDGEPENYTYSYTYDWTNSISSGYFEFNNLPVEQAAEGSITGPERYLEVHKAGYRPYYLPSYQVPLKDGFILTLGQQLNLLSEIKLQPKGELRGRVVDENGNAVKAFIISDKGPSVLTETIYGYYVDLQNGGQPVTYSTEEFSIFLPDGAQKITVKPLNAFGYSTEEYTLIIKPDDITELKDPLVVYSLKHRMQIQVLGPANQLILPVKDAEVKILDTTLITNMYGQAIYEFKNLGNQFDIEVIPSEQSMLCSKTLQVVNNNSKNLMQYSIILPQATKIYGKVTVGLNNEPVKHAKVFIENGVGGAATHTYTNDEGNYSLKVRLYPDESGLLGQFEKSMNIQQESNTCAYNSLKEELIKSQVPIINVPKEIVAQYNNYVLQEQSNYKLRVNAVKSSFTMTYVGDNKLVDIPANNPVDFNLTFYNDMNITKILGFPVEILTLKELSSSMIEVTGAFVSIPETENFTFVDPGQNLSFYSLKLTAGSIKDDQGVPYAKPVSSYVETLKPSLLLKLYNRFRIEAKPVSGNFMKVESDNAGNGVIYGKARIKEESFSINQGELGGDFLDDLYLGNRGTDNMKIDLFKSSQTLTFQTAGFGLMKSNGEPLAFTLFGFNASADPKTSFVLNDKLTLKAQLSLILPNTSQVTVHLGDLIITQTEIKKPASNDPINLSMEKWDLSFNNWNLTSQSGGISAAKGTLNAGGIILPFENILVMPNDLYIGNAILSDFTLGGVTKLNINQNQSNFNFGYDPSVGSDGAGHWSLSLIGNEGYPAGTFSGLPGMQPNAQFTLQSVELLSNGEQLMGFGSPTTMVPFYDVFKYTPNSIAVYPDYFLLSGTVDLDIPGLSEGYFAIMKFRKPASDILLELKPIPFKCYGKGNVSFSAGNNQTLDINGYIAEGLIVEEAQLFKNLNAKLYRKINTTTHVDLIPGQKLAIGTGNTTSLVQLDGQMSVSVPNTEWEYFSFSGDLEGTPGVTDQNKRLTFTVYGGVTADNQNISVKNMGTPFGSINIIYDFTANSLHGNITVIGKEFFGLGFENVMLEIQVDQKGWYFMGGGDIYAPVPIQNVKAGILIGNYSEVNQLMENNLMQYAYNKKLPEVLRTGIKGFFFTGQKVIQLPIPSYHEEMIVGSFDFGAEAGLDARFWMDFKDDLIFGTGAMIYANLHFKASSIICTHAYVCATAEMGVDGWYNTSSKTYGISGCGSIGLKAQASQCTGVEYVGCTKPCISIDVSKSLKINVSIASGQGLDCSLGWGSCSGNNINQGSCN